MIHNYIIGIDGGGSHCRAILQNSDGKHIGEGVSGASNIMSDPHKALSSIISASESAIADANLSVSLSDVVVMAGLAGANIPKAKDYFLSLPLPFKQTHIMSDLHAACIGAHRGANGALIICGTGSAATNYINGEFTDLGGYGLNLGDNASAAWLGLHAVKSTLLTMDGVEKENKLASDVIAHLGINSAQELVAILSAYQPSEFGALAPLVTKNYKLGCNMANELIQAGADYISSLIFALLEQRNTAKDDEKDMSVCFVGGLANIYIPLLSSSARKLLSSPKANAQEGAIHYFTAFSG